MISGFLISRIIFAEISEENFSFSAFYLRRAKRILPAFFVISIITMVAGYFILLPKEYTELSASWASSILFSANVYFFETTNYFGISASQMPMLHYWSLGVEEQFYIIFPLLIFVLMKWRFQVLVSVVILLTVASFLGAQIGLTISPTAVFYLLPFRAGELLIGTLTAVLSSRISCSYPNTVSVFGAVLVLASLIFLQHGFPFPGVSALPVCLGIGMIIWSSDKSNTVIARLLSTTPMGKIGRWSYSAYLIHWPLYIYTTRVFFQTNSKIIEFSVLIATIFLAWLSYEFLETPFRRIKNPRIIINFSFIQAGLCFLGCFIIYRHEGFPARFDDTINRYSSYLTYTNTKQFGGGCFLDASQTITDLSQNCLPKSHKLVVLWGDSGIAQYSEAFRKKASLHGYTIGQITTSACPPMLGFNPSIRPNCKQFNADALSLILAVKPTLVVLGSAWPSDDMSVYSYLENTVAALSKAQIPVIILGWGPYHSKPVPLVLIERIKVSNPSRTSDDDIYNLEVMHHMNEVLANTASKYSTGFINLFEVACPNDQCPLIINNEPINYDVYHLTPSGAEFVIDLIQKKVFI